MTTELARASAFEEAIRDKCVERTVRSRLGAALFNDSLPRVWSLNVLRVDSSATDAREIAAEAERLQGAAGLAHRRAILGDAALGQRLEPSFASLGWKTDAFVFMVAGDVPRPSGEQESAVREVEHEALLPLRRTILEEWLPEPDAETMRQIAESDRLFAQAGNARHFAAVADRLVVSAALLFSDGRTAQVEDVATLPEYRGRGYASAVVLRAVEEARATGHDFVFLIADARAWPKELYARLGFEPVGEKYAYLRTL